MDIVGLPCLFRFSSASHSAVRQFEASYCLLRLGFLQEATSLTCTESKITRKPVYQYIYRYIYLMPMYIYTRRNDRDYTDSRRTIGKQLRGGTNLPFVSVPRPNLQIGSVGPKTGLRKLQPTKATLSSTLSISARLCRISCTFLKPNPICTHVSRERYMNQTSIHGGQ